MSGGLYRRPTTRIICTLGGKFFSSILFIVNLFTFEIYLSFLFHYAHCPTRCLPIVAGHVDPVALERARKELIAVSTGGVASLHVARVPALTAAIVELDARLTGLRRAHYLRSISASACETLECWFGTALVGYAFMLELRRAYWIVQVRAHSLS